MDLNKILICYDLKNEEQSVSDKVIEYIKKFPKWKHQQKSMWIVFSNKSYQTIYLDIKKLISEKSFLYVQDITNNSDIKANLYIEKNEKY